MFDSDFKTFPWRRFKDFISPRAGRFALLKEILDESVMDYKILEIAGNRHFFIAPPREHFLHRPPAVLVAHYDRAEGSPGANDNSAAVFIVFETALKLWEKNIRNWIIIFTDKEELQSGESIRSQGSYSLALRLKSLKMENARIYNFDACGTGDTLVISTTLEYLLKRERSGGKLRDSVAELRKLALDTARGLGLKKVLLAPTPFSDDVGFFSAGLAAQTITMLPSSECIQLVAELHKNQNYAEALISAELRKSSSIKSIPETWRCFNSPSDSHLRLTPQNFQTVIRFAGALCQG
ncbi:MAG: M28 family peptidase [Treponema sp.]|nr:M28 family peptidase [Treponema sp.]